MAESDLNKKEIQWEKLKNQNYGLKELSQHNKKLTKEFLGDFELGINVPKGNKGRRSPGTLLKLRGYCLFLNKHFPKKDFDKIIQKDIHLLFDRMHSGEIKKDSGKKYRDVGDFIKGFKVFWGWMIKTKKVKENVAEDLTASSFKKQKPAWVYLEHEQIKLLIDTARGDYRALILFLYDSGLRPQEAYRIRIYDFRDNYSSLNVPEIRENGKRVSKTFERTIKLKNCSQMIKNYIETNNLKSDDLLIGATQPAFNKYLRTLSKRLFGTDKTKARGRYDQLKLYDIRHISAVYWLDRYKRNKDLMYRMGWSREDKIFYYTEFLGRRDKIDDEDMLTIEDKTRYEKDIDKLKKQETLNLELLKKLSSITQVLLKQAMENKSTKGNLKKQLIEYFSEKDEANHLQVISPPN